MLEELKTQADIIRELRTRIDTVATAAAIPKPLRFPDPGKFDGLKHHTYPEWKKKLEAKLRADHERLGDESHQAWLVCFSDVGITSIRLGRALDQLPPNPSADALLAHLDLYYLDPSHQERASQKLYASKQGGQPLAPFLAKFDQLLLEAGGTGWPESTKITLLRNAIRPNLLLFLVGRSPCRSYEEFEQSLRDVDNNYSLLMNGSEKCRPLQSLIERKQLLTH